MAGISTRQGAHQVAQTFTNVTDPRYRSRSETESPVARSTAWKSGARAPTSTRLTPRPNLVRAAPPISRPPTTEPTRIHCFDMIRSHPHGTMTLQVPHCLGRVGRAEHRSPRHE